MKSSTKKKTTKSTSKKKTTKKVATKKVSPKKAPAKKKTAKPSTKKTSRKSPSKTKQPNKKTTKKKNNVSKTPAKPKKEKQKKSTGIKAAIKGWLKRIGFTILVIFILSMIWGQVKPIPEGMYTESETILVHDENVEFLYDLTSNGEERMIEQEIFDSVFQLVVEAEEFVVIDMFLFGDKAGNPDLINLSRIFTDELLLKTRTSEVPIYFITDDFNTFYRSNKNPMIEELKKAGVEVIYTDLDKIRDTNPIFNSLWRVFVMPFGKPNYEGGMVPNFLGEGTVSLKSVFTLANFKANHRKLAISEKEIVIASANPHTGSSLHSNVGIRVRSPELVYEMLESEKGVAKFSGSEIDIELERPESSEGEIELKYITEKKIDEEIVEEIKSAKEGDSIDIGMFYFSKRSIVKELKKATERGVEITVVLDANKDAFGKEKNGIPNRQVALELQKKGVNIMWYETDGEQFHTKIFIKTSGSKTTVILGSANYTKRNIGNYNLEADLEVVAPNDSVFVSDINEYWAKVLENSLEYEAFEDKSKFRYWLYRFQEWSGLSTF